MREFCEICQVWDEMPHMHFPGEVPVAPKPQEERTREGYAIRFTGNNAISLLRWVGNPHWDNEMLHTTDNPFVETNSGPVLMEKDDWVIRTESGELIVCTPRSAALQPGDKIEEPK